MSMRRLLTLAATFLCCATTSFAQFSGSGSGTENDPYLIFNPIQLNQLRNFLNQSNVYFKLMADIDLTDFLEDENPSQGWLPVGTSSTPFKGILEGNDKTISGFWINRSNTNYQGLFGSAHGATVRNLTLKSTSVKGLNYVGFLSGYGGNFDNCCTDGNTLTGSDYVGGIVGYTEESISNCKVVTTDRIYGSEYVGGICGANNNGNNYLSGHDLIMNCYVYASVRGGQYVGGICGQIHHRDHVSHIKNCGFVGRAIAGDGYVGGICGDYYGAATMSGCFAIGYVENDGNHTGGLVGYASETIELKNSYFSGSVTGKEQTGGLVGYQYGNGSSSNIKNCYAYASITGTKSVGGLVGKIVGYGLLDSNASIVTSVRVTEGYGGRVFGESDGYSTIGAMGSTKENKAYNRAIVINSGVAQDITDNLQNGTGVSTNTLKLKATYVTMGFDFNNTWEIQETECYPYMKTQTAPPVITSQLVSGATTVSGKCIDGGTVTLEIDGVMQQEVSTANTFSFTVSPLQAGHEVRISAKADGKEQSYYTTETVSYIGKGTEADPYQVYTASDLTGVYRKGYFKLMNDIDLTDYINQFSPTEGWQSIGRDGSETVHFDGNGHKITGLWCNTTRNNTGLFSTFANGEIKNLTVEVANGKQVKGGANTGIIIGKMVNGTIENCKVVGKVADGTPVGGIIGLLDGGSISKSQATVTINTTGTNSYVGGIVGEITSGTIDQCVTTGTLTATGTESYVGGIIGKNSATVTNCYSTATVTSSYNAAGIVAYNYGVVDMCYATGNLNSNNYAAGVIGYNDGSNAIVRNCVAMNNKIEVTYESQQVQQGGGYGQRIIGGIKNNAPAPEMNNYALKTMQVSLNDVPQKVYDDIMNGTAKTAAELKQKATYQELDWDFDNVWQIDEDESYPYQTVKVDGGSDPDDPNNPDNPDDPQGEVEVTDVSSISNVIYIEPMEEMCGTQATISLKMKNTAAIRGFQFDLYLPEGVTVVKSSKGKIQGFLSEGRLPDEDEHSLTFSEQADGAIRFLCSSQYDETFTGNDGEIATLRVNIANDMADGDYPLQMKNIKLTETDISKYYETPLVKCKLTIKSYTLGDINSDGTVDVSDYTGVANHIHGDTPQGFVVKAGDVDGSGTIDVSDYTGIANIIHTGSIYGSNAARAMSRSLKKANTDISSNNNVIYIETFAVAPGSQTAISIKMKNTAAIRGFQFDLYLPEGMTAVKSAKGRIQGALNASRLPEDDEHDLTFSEQQDGAIRFLCSSQYDETFTGNDGEIATLQVAVAENMTANDYPIVLRNIKLTETDISKFYTTEELETTVTVNSAGDERLLLDEAATDAPDNATGADVRVVRTIAAGNWSTICLPFAMTEAQVKTAFGNGVQLGDFTSWSPVKEGGNVVGINVGFTTVTAIEANHPYIIKVEEPVTEFTVDGVNIAASAEPKVQVGTKAAERGYMYGTYTATTVPEENVFLSGNKFYYSVGDSPIKAFRAYFEFRDVLDAYYDVAEARITFSLDGNTLDATLVNSVEVKSEQLKSEIYNLNGQRVSKAGKGVYIVNGKKVVIK